MPQYPLKVKEVPIEKGKKPSGFLYAHVYDATGVKLSALQTISKGIDNSYPSKINREDLPPPEPPDEELQPDQETGGEVQPHDDRWRQMPPKSASEPRPTTPDPDLKAPGVEPRKNGNGRKRR